MGSLAAILGPLCAFMASVTWAVGSAVYSRVAKTYHPATINTTRALITLPIFVLLVIASHGLSLASFYTVTTTHVLWLALGIFSAYAVGDALFYISSHSIGVPSALAIASVYPLWSALFGYFFLNQALGAIKWLCILIIVGGVVLVIVSGVKSVPHGNGLWKGVLLALGTSIMWATNSLATAKGSLGQDVFTSCLIRMCFAVLFCPLTALIIKRQIVRPLIIPWHSLRPVLGLFLFESVGGTLFFVYAFKHTPVAVAAVLTSLSPVIAIPIALWHKTDHITLAKAIGIILVVVGVAVLVG